MGRRSLRLRASGAILAAAFASFVLSVTLWFTGSHDQGIFVGLWVPSILAFGAVALLISGDGNE
jgi:ABC-type multidrug transport system permease subunit